MKRIVGLLLVVLALTAAAEESLAQETPYLRIPHRFIISLDAGIGVPMAPEIFKKTWNTTLPFNIGVGDAIFVWWDLSFMYGYTNFGANSLEAKRQIGWEGTAAVTGGSIKTNRYVLSSRFIAVPSQRANPFFEVEVGQFKTSAEDLEVEGVFTNTMESVDGVTYSFGIGIQYTLNESWSAYTKFVWTTNVNEEFAPTNLLLDPTAGDVPTDGDGNQQFGSLLVGLMIRI
jgi:hypothetical protein